MQTSNKQTNKQKLLLLWKMHFMYFIIIINIVIINYNFPPCCCR